MILFPASCNYWRWGAGGQQENINAVCVLALNMINDKVDKFKLYKWSSSFISSGVSDPLVVVFLHCPDWSHQTRIQDDTNKIILCALSSHKHEDEPVLQKIG